jgi:hypothetical protein
VNRQGHQQPAGNFKPTWSMLKIKQEVSLACFPYAVNSTLKVVVVGAAVNPDEAPGV